MSAVMGAVLTAAKWNSYGDFSRKATAVVTTTALVSSVCVIGLVILSGHPITGTIIAVSTVVGCSLAAIKSLCQQWYNSEPSQTFFKQVLNHVTSRSFVYGAIAGIGAFAALIAATRPGIRTVVEPMPCLNPAQEAAGCCREIDRIRQRIKDGSITINNGPRV